MSAEWEERLADLWAALDELDEEAFLARIDALTAERGDDDAIALFERAPRATRPATRTLRCRCTGGHSSSGWRASGGGAR